VWILNVERSPLQWKGRKNAALIASVAEAISVTDTCTASWGTSASVAETATITDIPDYPHTANWYFIGDDAPIVWRQPERVVGFNYSASVVESLSVTDSYSETVGWNASVAEQIIVVDISTANVTTPGTGAGHGGRPPKPPKPPRPKRHEEAPHAAPAVAQVTANIAPAAVAPPDSLPVPDAVQPGKPDDDDELTLLLLM
jgi:hypothetical protein